MSTTRRTFIAAALCATALGAGSASAHASIHVELPPDPIAGEGLEVRVSGMAEPRSHVLAGTAEPGDDCGRRCDWVYEIDERVGGAFDERERMFSLEPGEHRLCAWLVHDGAAEPYEQVAVPFTVREGRFEITVDAPAVLPLGAEVRAEVSGFGDGTPSVLLDVRRSILQGCDSAALPEANVTVRGPSPSPGASRG
jgi:hypothetical protein